MSVGERHHLGSSGLAKLDSRRKTEASAGAQIQSAIVSSRVHIKAVGRVQSCPRDRSL